MKSFSLAMALISSQALAQDLTIGTAIIQPLTVEDWVNSQYGAKRWICDDEKRMVLVIERGLLVAKCASNIVDTSIQK